MKNIRWVLILVICFLFFRAISVFAADLVGYAKVSGYVKDSITNLPISGANVILTCGSTRLRIETNSSGYYEFLKIPIYREKKKLIDSAMISVFAEKYFPMSESRNLSIGQSYFMAFNLNPRFLYPIVKGRVFDSSSWRGIPNAVVTATCNDNVFSAITDQQGNYLLQIETKVSRIYLIEAKADQYHSALPKTLMVFPGKTYTLNLYMEHVIALGVSVSPDNWPIGNLGASSVATMKPGQQIIVTNTGNDNLTYSLMVVSPEGWTASQAVVGTEQYILYACFSSGISSISWDENKYALLETSQRCSGIKFAGDQNGVNVFPGQQRSLWLQFKAPTSTIIKKEQRMEVIINAEMP